METKQYTTIDKSSWGEGEWQAEPDKVQWPDEATGLPCLAVRHPSSGHWCGYVGVAEGHPLYGVGYDDAYDRIEIDVHGGLTYANACAPSETEKSGVRHVPSEGEPDHVWWFGFDCAHSGDLQPAYAARYPELSHFDDESYRSLGYVQKHCRWLAKSLRDAGEAA